MKTIYFGHSTARWYWTHAQKAAETLKTQPSRRVMDNAATCEKDVVPLVRGTLFCDHNIALHATSPSRGTKDGAHVQFHYSNDALPYRSFIQLTPSIYIASPEFSFVQAAAELPFSQLVHYGCALCGTYALDESSPWGLVSRNPASSQAKLAKFVNQCHNISGLPAARKALPYILENSRSPRESTAGLLMSLPYKHGGKGLENLQLNKRIDIPVSLQSITDRSYFVADFFWPGKMVTGEYDSDLAHTGNEPRLTDAIKRNVLPVMGYTPFTLTRLHVDSRREMDKACENVRLLLKTHPRQKVPDDYLQRRARLHQELLSISDYSSAIFEDIQKKSDK